MNRWARRHRAALEAGLDEGELLLAALDVRIHGRRLIRTDLPVPARMFALGVTDRRVLMWRISRWRAHPIERAFAAPLGSIAAMGVRLSPGGKRLAVQVGTTTLVLGPLGPFSSVQPLADAFTAATGGRSR